MPTEINYKGEGWDSDNEVTFYPKDQYGYYLIDINNKRRNERKEIKYRIVERIEAAIQFEITNYSKTGRRSFYTFSLPKIIAEGFIDSFNTCVVATS